MMFNNRIDIFEENKRLREELEHERRLRKQLATMVSFASAGETNWLGISLRLFGASIPVSSAAA